MFMINTTDPIVTLLLLAATVLLIFLGKEIKKPVAPAIALVAFLALLVMHTVQLGIAGYAEYAITLRYCVIFELLMVLMTFFAYLWIDDISSKFYNKKSLDNSLDWFWKQI